MDWMCVVFYVVVFFCIIIIIIFKKIQNDKKLHLLSLPMNALTELDQSLFELLMAFILFHSFIDPPDFSIGCIYLYNCFNN